MSRLKISLDVVNTVENQVIGLENATNVCRTYNKKNVINPTNNNNINPQKKRDSRRGPYLLSNKASFRSISKPDLILTHRFTVTPNRSLNLLE